MCCFNIRGAQATDRFWWRQKKFCASGEHLCNILWAGLGRKHEKIRCPRHRSCSTAEKMAPAVLGRDKPQIRMKSRLK